MLYPISTGANIKLNFIKTDGTSLLIESLSWNQSEQLQVILGCGVRLVNRDVAELCRHLSVIQNVSRDPIDYRVLAIEDFVELRGQSLWTSMKFISQERDASEWITPALQSIPFSYKIVAKPAVRAKLTIQDRWSRLVGLVRLKELPNPNAIASDAFGQSNLHSRMDSTNQNFLQIVALKEGALVQLLKIDPSQLAAQASTIEANIEGFREVYFVVDTQDKFSVRHEFIFEGLRFCNDNQ